MKRTLLITTSLIFVLSLFGCGTTTKANEFEDQIIEKTEVSEDTSNLTDDYEKEREEFDASVPEDFPQPEFEDDYVEKGAVVHGLETLNLMDNPMVFQNDINIYLEYCFPDIDKLYNVYVIEGSEQESSTCRTFKVRVEGIMDDGSDLEVKCMWEFGAVTHYNFFSDLTPRGTRFRVDANGNPIVYEH